MKSKTSTKGKRTRNGPSPTGKKPKKKGKGDIMLTTLAVGAVSILGYLGWQYYKKRRSQKAAVADLTVLPPAKDSIVLPDSATRINRPVNTTADAPANAKASSPKQPASSDFPLKKGSKGALVKNLQQALIARYGAGILPKYGADGSFGAETATALKKAGLPVAIDESTYYVVLQGNTAIPDRASLANKLFHAASSGDFASTLSLLKQMNTKEDYRLVNEIFSQNRLRGVRQTLVNGLLNSFTKDEQKQQLRYEFIRMGLRYNGNQWSLDGFDRPIVTVEPATVWVNPRQKVTVPAQMVLGSEVSRKLDYTLFSNNNRYFLVATSSIKYL